MQDLQLSFKTRNDKQLLGAHAWIDDETEQILYGGAKGGGKSFLGASLVFGDALIYPDTHYFIARKELNDLRKFTIPTIHEVFQKFGIDFKTYASYNGQDNYFSLYNDSKVYLIACKEEPSDPLFERFGSMQMTRGWLEEGGEVAEAAKDNLWLSIGRWKNDVYGLKKKLLITANPKKGWMKRDFVEPFEKGLLPKSRKYIQAFSTDNPYLPEGYTETLKNQKDTVSRQRLWEGRWDYDEDKDSLISYDALSDSFTNTITKEDDRYLTVDVARLGRDSTVFSFWQGLELYKVEKRSKQGTDITAQNVKDFAASDRIPYSHILIDEDGIGGGVVDNLKGVRGFTANSTPFLTAHQIHEKQSKVAHSLVPQTTFGNLKAQCGWKLSELINEHKIAFKAPDIRDEVIEELSAQLRDREVDSEGRKLLRAKDDVKEEIGHSPDLGDTIIMRAYFELLKDASGQSDTLVKAAQEEQEIRFDRNKRNKVINSSK